MISSSSARAMSSALVVESTDTPINHINRFVDPILGSKLRSMAHRMAP